MAMVQNQWDPIWGVGAPPILEAILVGIGMFTGGTGGHGVRPFNYSLCMVHFGLHWKGNEALLGSVTEAREPTPGPRRPCYLALGMKMVSPGPILRPTDAKKPEAPTMKGTAFFQNGQLWKGVL